MRTCRNWDVPIVASSISLLDGFLRGERPRHSETSTPGKVTWVTRAAGKAFSTALAHRAWRSCYRCSEEGLNRLRAWFDDLTEPFWMWSLFNGRIVQQNGCSHGRFDRPCSIFGTYPLVLLGAKCLHRGVQITFRSAESLRVEESARRLIPENSKVYQFIVLIGLANWQSCAWALPLHRQAVEPQKKCTDHFEETERSTRQEMHIDSFERLRPKGCQRSWNTSTLLTFTVPSKLWTESLTSSSENRMTRWMPLPFAISRGLHWLRRSKLYP